MFQPSMIQADFCSGTDIAPDSLIAVICKRMILLKENFILPRCGELPSEMVSAGLLKIGTLMEQECYALLLAELPAEMPSMQFRNDREVLAEGPMDLRQVLCRAREMLTWRKQHQYCGVCQTKLQPSTHDLAMVCDHCGTLYFPQIAPAVIVAITRNHGQEILLAHNRRFQDGVYSLIAGFIEAGESAEQAVHREIMEETSVRVGAIQYIGSQSWPFPNSLMLAYQAEYLDGEPCPDGEELSDCRWFTRENLPQRPSAGSIGHRVLEQFRNGTLPFQTQK